MVRWLLALVILGHGIGHTMGVLQMLRVATINPSWDGRSWLLTEPLGATATQVVGCALWIGATIGFIAVAGVVVGWLPAAWFVPLVIVSSGLSLAGVVLFPVAFPTFSTIGAVVVDVALLVLVGIGWVPAQALD